MKAANNEAMHGMLASKETKAITKKQGTDIISPFQKKKESENGREGGGSD